MENAADALYIAGAVLILVLALGFSMVSFTRIRTQFDRIIETDTKIDLAKDDTDSYINYITNLDNSDIRTVGMETIVSSMYRVTKENYNMYIVLKNNISNLTKTGYNTQIYKDIRNNVEKSLITSSSNVIKISLSNDDTNDEISINGYKDIDEILRTNSADSEGNDLYNNLIGKKFEEYLGVYQIESAEGVSSENKATYRVITYVEI